MDIIKVFEINDLLDIYGGLLTEKQQTIMKFYYQEDLSLTEISEVVGISRQAVHDSIKKSEKQIFNYEKTLNFKSTVEKLDVVKERLDKFADSNTSHLSKEQLSQIQDIIKYCEKGE